MLIKTIVIASVIFSAFITNSTKAQTSPTLPLGIFPIVVGFGPNNVNTEFDKARNAAFNGVSPTSLLATQTQVTQMLTMANSRGMAFSAVWDGDYNTIINNPASTSAQVNTAIDTLYSRYGTYSSNWYWYLKDEPSKTHFTNIQTAATRMKSKSTKARLVNLFPSYASCQQLAGTAPGSPCSYTYQSYVRDFVSTATNVNFVTVDHYPFNTDGTVRNDWFFTLETVRKEALSYSREYGAVIQGAGAPSGQPGNPTPAQLRWQAYSALAYGNKLISFFSWVDIPDESLIGYGASTTDLSEITVINNKVRDIGKYLIKAKSSAIWHADTNRPFGTSGRPAVSPVTFSTNIPILVGEFTITGNTGKYVLIGNRSFNLSNIPVTLCPTTSTGYVWYLNGIWYRADPNQTPGRCANVTFDLVGGDAALFYLQ